MSALTVGAIVWYHPALPHNLPNKAQHPDTEIPGPAPGQALAAIVAHVVSDTSANLAVFDAHGVSHARKAVAIWDGKGDEPTGGYAEPLGQKREEKKSDKDKGAQTGGIFGIGAQPARAGAPELATAE